MGRGVSNLESPEPHSCRASEREIQIFDDWNFMGSQNFFSLICPLLEARRMNIFLHNLHIHFVSFIVTYYQS